ncbi:transposase family protein [Streptomyces sp. NPDC086549]|uniref:transposase family protein n=1 Tax=Streptomyces sp. NPDC086549 TaxID=3365752 RepID=UPI0037F70C36
MAPSTARDLAPNVGSWSAHSPTCTGSVACRLAGRYTTTTSPPSPRSRTRRHRRPRLHRPGRRPRQPSDHHRLQGRPHQTPHRAKKQINKLIAAERAACEHAFAHLKNWRILNKLRLHARHATTLLRALLVLTNLEIAR